MNRDEAKRVLAELSRLNRLPYGPAMIDTWANALYDVTEVDGLDAVVALVRDGVADITAASVTSWLRDRRTAERREGTARMTIEVGCACSFGTICTEHQRIGLAALAQIKQERPVVTRWSLVTGRSRA